jgi:uncharacterized RDD family membrane protein YckC
MAGAQPGWGWQPQSGFMAPYAPPMQGGYPPPYGRPPYGQMWGYGQTSFGGSPEYAGFWIRLAAYVIDSLVISMVFFYSFLALFTPSGFILIPLVAFGYYPYFWSKRGATLGMEVMGLRVVRAIDGGPIDVRTAIVRMVGFYINGMAFDLGFAWVAFEPRKRGWHDMMADTVVIHVK